MSNLIVFTEDTHGKKFFKNIINRLKDNKVITVNPRIGTTRFSGPCNQALGAKMIAKRVQLDYDKFLIIADADGYPIDEIKKRITIHIPNSYLNDTEVVLMEHEIEEWICCSEKIKFDEKPSKILKHLRGYRKNKLPQYAERLNLEILKGCESYRSFLECLEKIG